MRLIQSASRLNSVARVRGCSMIHVRYAHINAQAPRSPRFESGRRDLNLNERFKCKNSLLGVLSTQRPNSVVAYHEALSRLRPGFESRSGRLTKLNAMNGAKTFFLVFVFRSGRYKITTWTVQKTFFVFCLPVRACIFLLEKFFHVEGLDEDLSSKNGPVAQPG